MAVQCTLYSTMYKKITNQDNRKAEQWSSQIQIKLFDFPLSSGLRKLQVTPFELNIVRTCFFENLKLRNSC